jgi:hypothetical protein
MIARDTSQIITVVMICLGENMRESRRLSIAKIERFGKRKPGVYSWLSQCAANE